MSRLPDEIRQQVETLLRAGHSDLDVHRQTGVDRGTVRRYRKHLGLPGYRVTADSPACRHGHPFPENVAHYPNGWLYCLACSRTRDHNRPSISRPRKASTRRPQKSRTRQPRKRTSTYLPVQPDEIAIERAVAGDPPDRLTPRERAAAIAQLDRRGYSVAVIAEYVRCTPRTVHRARNRAAA